MTNDILSNLQTGFATFSKGQRRIAKYIYETYDKAAFMTASKLGRTVGVSESTVVRFAMELGYDGYPSMQKALQEMILNKLTSVQRIEVAQERMGDQDVLSLVLESDAEKIHRTLEGVDRESFQAAVNAILRARKIFILGVRSSSSLANFLGYYLNYMFQNVHLITSAGTGEMMERLVGVTPEDAVIAISFPRYSIATVRGAQFCRAVGAVVIGVTDGGASPVGQSSDYVLAAKSDMVSLVDSLVAPLSLINALIVATAARREKELTKTFENLEHIWDEYNVYEKLEEEARK